ncbi:MAG TPA: nuclear transport factor 2 family protein [Puia sp.]|nr:nuclear transport factor 2 family protein [Puia sp.]
MERTTKTEKVNRNHPAFNKNSEPFYSIVMEGLKGKVEGDHFWDAVAENAVFEFLYNIPGFTNKIVGRKSYMDWFAGYSMVLHSADHLKVYETTDGNIVILEYQVHGVAPTGKPYNNSFCSIITIKDRRIIHWRDYMDSLAVMLAVTADK